MQINPKEKEEKYFHPELKPNQTKNKEVIRNSDKNVNNNNKNKVT